MNLFQLMVVSVLWEDLYTCTPPLTGTLLPPPGDSEMYSSNSCEVRGLFTWLSISQAHFWPCVYLAISPLLSYTHCLLHLGAISPSYLPQIRGVTALRGFVLVPLHGSGKRERKTAQASLLPASFPVLHFLWLWGWGFSMLVYLYVM